MGFIDRVLDIPFPVESKLTVDQIVKEETKASQLKFKKIRLNIRKISFKL